MAITIAVSGKGGTGKTTLSAMIIRVLIEKAKGSVLAVDADPNSCLSLTLGEEEGQTIADVREMARNSSGTNEGMDRTRMLEYGIQQLVVEGKGFDIVTMGRPEGPSCYCAANNLLRKFLDKLSDAYKFVMLDNEAGMEHLSRRTTNNVDLLVIAAEPNRIGKVTAGRIGELTKKLPITIKRTGVIWNKSDKLIDIEGLENFGCVPFDQAVVDCAMNDKSIFDLDSDNSALSAVRSMVESLLN